MTRYLSQADVDALDDGTLVEVTWPGRKPMRLRTRRFPSGVVWAVTRDHGYAAGPLKNVGVPPVIVRLVEKRPSGQSDPVAR
jgi:hypothetical protein